MRVELRKNCLLVNYGLIQNHFRRQEVLLSSSKLTFAPTLMTVWDRKCPPPALGSGLSPPADLWSHTSVRQEVALSEWWTLVFRFPQKSSQRLCRNGDVYQENVSGAFQRPTNGIKEGRNEGSKRPLKPLALLSEEFSPSSCHGDGQLKKGLRSVSQKQEVSLMFLQLQSQPNTITHLQGVNMKSVLVRLQERCVCVKPSLFQELKESVSFSLLTSCWTSTVPLCMIGELFRKWKSDAGISLVGACEPDGQLPKLLTFQPGDRKSGTGWLRGSTAPPCWDTQLPAVLQQLHTWTTSP